MQWNMQWSRYHSIKGLEFASELTAVDVQKHISELSRRCLTLDWSRQQLVRKKTVRSILLLLARNLSVKNAMASETLFLPLKSEKYLQISEQ